MNDDALWDGFADAVVRADLPTGRALITPRPAGVIGVFPFVAPVHIITAYNPGGSETDEEINLDRHRSLAAALTGRSVFPTVGSAPDGSMQEPGFGVLNMSLGDAVALANSFGQLAVYRWTADALCIVDGAGRYRRRLGWSLSTVR